MFAEDLMFCTSGQLIVPFMQFPQRKCRQSRTISEFAKPLSHITFTGVYVVLLQHCCVCSYVWYGHGPWLIAKTLWDAAVFFAQLDLYREKMLHTQRNATQEEKESFGGKQRRRRRESLLFFVTADQQCIPPFHDGST